MAKNDVVVKLSQNKVAGSEGFGVPLVVLGMQEAAKAYVECSGVDEVIDAGYSADSAVYKQCEKLFMQNNPPARVGVCTGTGKISETLRLLSEQDFRQVIPVFGEEGDDTPKELASYIETTEDKMLFLRFSDVAQLEAVGPLNRTVGIVYAGEDEGVEGAVAGATAGLTIGSFTYKNILIKGITPDALTDGQISAIHKKYGIAIVKKAGDIVTSEGTVLSGEYVDVIDSQDYIIHNIAYKSQKLLNTSPKLSFDNVGISQLEGVVTNVLSEAFSMGIIAQTEDKTPDYETMFATREECSAGDRAKRTYNGGRFRFSLAGAVHYATINGVIEV